MSDWAQRSMKPKVCPGNRAKIEKRLFVSNEYNRITKERTKIQIILFLIISEISAKIRGEKNKKGIM